VTLKVDQLKYRNTEPISRYFEIPIPNTDTDVKYRHRPMTNVNCNNNGHKIVRVIKDGLENQHQQLFLNVLQ